MGHRLPDERVGCHMNHRLDRVIAECSPDGLAVRQVRLYEFRPFRNRCGVAFLEVVIDDHFMAGIEKHLRYGATDVPCTAGNQNTHSEWSLVSAGMCKAACLLFS